MHLSILCSVITFARSMQKSPPPTTAVAAAKAPAPGAGLTDFDYLIFALNLECLQAQYYSLAAFGVPMNGNLTGGGPPPQGGAKANLVGPPNITVSAPQRYHAIYCKVKDEIL